jgi:hypothetical protein
MIYSMGRVIEMIYSSPELKKLNNQRCFDSLKERLPLRFQKKVSISYKRKKIILRVTHPTIKIELLREIDNLKDALNTEKSCRYISENYVEVDIFVAEFE